MTKKNALASVTAASLTIVACALPAAAQLSDDRVKIGIMTDMTGAYSDVGGKGSVEAAKMAIADFGGKVEGMPIELISADHQNKPDVASNIARQWYDVDKVDMITDLMVSSVALAVQEITREKNRVAIFNGSGSSDLTGKACSPNGIHWTYDTYALAKGTGMASVQTGADSWFFITADYTFGHVLERDTANFVTAAGGKVLGQVRHPFPNADFSSFLLQAQASGAKIIGLANSGQDTIQSVKQASEFGIAQGNQRLAALLLFITDVHSMGLQSAQSLVLTTGFYWDFNDDTRAFARRFHERHKAMPSMVQAGVYSSIVHYLKAVEAIGADGGKAVVEQMKKTPVNDFFAKNGIVRQDGRMVHDMYLAQVKKPAEAKGPWDYYKILKVIPGNDAFRPLGEGGCPLVKG